MANFNSSQKSSSSWAPLAIGALVVLIILCVIYYYYYARVNKTCVKEYVKFMMPGADDTLVDAVTEWESTNVITTSIDGKCNPGYSQLAPPPGASCQICEVIPSPVRPAELQGKVSTWAATPPAKAFIKSQDAQGVIRPPWLM